MGDFVNKKPPKDGQAKFEFSLRDQQLTREQKAERKIYRRIAKNNYNRRCERALASFAEPRGGKRAKRS